MQPPKTRPGATPGQELRHGDRMTREEFRRLYEAHPDGTKFELVGGVVRMASPLHRPHGTTSPELNGVFWFYKAHTPGVEVAESMTAVLSADSEVQPDLMLRLLTECGGQSSYERDRELRGAPELVAEVSEATRAVDLGAKRKDYLDAGVQEYVVADLQERKVHWFHFPSRRRLKPTAEGVYRSRVFPGLWLDGPALFARDTLRLLAALREGLATEAHAGFARLLEERRSRHA